MYSDVERENTKEAAKTIAPLYSDSQAARQNQTRKKLAEVSPFSSGYSEVSPFSSARRDEETSPLQMKTRDDFKGPSSPFARSGGNPYAGTPLSVSGNLAESIQDSFGINTDELSLRESPEVADMGARATAQGDVIRFAPGEFNPDTHEGLSVLGHELNHVRGQADGGVNANVEGTNIHYDAGHESASDLAGEAFASGTLADAAAVGAVDLAGAEGMGVECWGDNVHKKDTEEWAGSYFTKNEASLIGEADKDVDGAFSGTGPLVPRVLYEDNEKKAERFSWHFDMSYWKDGKEGQYDGEDTRTKHFNEEYQMAKASLLAGKKEDAFKHFGKGLHPLQDVYAHLDWKPMREGKDGILGSNVHAHEAYEQKYNKDGSKKEILEESDKSSKYFDNKDYELRKETRTIRTKTWLGLGKDQFETKEIFVAYQTPKDEKGLPTLSGDYQTTMTETKKKMEAFSSIYEQIDAGNSGAMVRSSGERKLAESLDAVKGAAGAISDAVGSTMEWFRNPDPNVVAQGFFMFLSATQDEVKALLSFLSGDRSKSVIRQIVRWLAANPAALAFTKNDFPDYIRVPVNKAFYTMGFYTNSSDPLGGLINDVFGAAGFFKDDEGVYHTKVDCPQAVFGYNDYYDIGFDLGTLMETKKFPFTYFDEEKGKNVNLIFWAWKGDYLNLGAGAELGIYTESERQDLGEQHWDVDKINLIMDMKLLLEYIGEESKYKKIGKTISDYQPSAKQWWITAFNPKYQKIAPKDLSATFTVNFFDKQNPNKKSVAMYEAFSTSYGNVWNCSNGTATFTF